MVKRGSIIRFTRNFTPLRREDGDVVAESTSDEWILHGIFATSGMKADGLNITPRALVGSVPGFLRWPVGFASHKVNARDAIGRVVHVEPREVKLENGELATGLYGRMMLSKAEPDIWTKANEGILAAWSIGFGIQEFEPRAADDGVDVTRMDLFDVSLVPVPLDTDAWASPAREAKAAPASFVADLDGVAAVAAGELMASAALIVARLAVLG